MTMFPAVFEKDHLLLETEEPVFIEGNAEVSEDGVQVLVQSMVLLSVLEKEQAKRMVLHLRHEDQGFNALSTVRDVLSRYPGDCPVRFFVQLSDTEYEIDAGKEFVVDPTEELSSELGTLVGPEAVYFE